MYVCGTIGMEDIYCIANGYILGSLIILNIFRKHFDLCSKMMLHYERVYSQTFISN